MVVLGPHQERYGSLVETPALPVPLLYAVQRALARQVEHEQDGDGVVTHERQHVDELALPAEVPDAERDLRVADGDSLLHEIDAERLDVVLVPRPLDILDHERRLADLRVAHHADLDDDARRFCRRLPLDLRAWRVLLVLVGGRLGVVGEDGAHLGWEAGGCCCGVAFGVVG